MSAEELRAAAQRVMDEWDALGPTGSESTLSAHRALRAALAAPSTPEPSGLLTADQCGALGLCEKPRGHEGTHTTSVDRALRAAPSTEPALDDPLMLTSGWTITITEHSDGGYYEPPSQHVSVEWSSPHVTPIRVNEPTIEDALRAIRARLAESQPPSTDYDAASGTEWPRTQ